MRNIGQIQFCFSSNRKSISFSPHQDPLLQITQTDRKKTTEIIKDPLIAAKHICWRSGQHMMTSCFGEAHKAAVLFFPFKASLKKHWPVFIIYKSAFWIPALFLAQSSCSHLYICRASLPLFRLVCLGAGLAFPSIPCFFSVEDCQGLSRHNSLHTLCSHQPHEEEVGGHDVTFNQ